MHKQRTAEYHRGRSLLPNRRQARCDLVENGAAIAVFHLIKTRTIQYKTDRATTTTSTSRTARSGRLNNLCSNFVTVCLSPFMLFYFHLHLHSLVLLRVHQFKVRHPDFTISFDFDERCAYFVDIHRRNFPCKPRLALPRGTDNAVN